jgi:hypothetical protein
VYLYPTLNEEEKSYGCCPNNHCKFEYNKGFVGFNSYYKSGKAIEWGESLFTG